MSSHPRIAAIGEILWDLLPGGKQLGGAPANFIHSIVRQGIPAAMISRIGSDPLGEETQMRLESAGIRTDWIQIDPNQPTGTARATIDADGQAQFTIDAPAAWDFLEFDSTACDWIPTIEAICFGTLAQRHPVSRSAILTCLGSISEDRLKICDLNLRAPFWDRERIHQSLLVANVVKLNEPELAILREIFSLPNGEFESLRQLAMQYSIRAVALTRGANGALLLRGEEHSNHRGFPVEVVDTIGAGDAFTASWILGLLQGDSLDVINEAANRMAAQACTRSGAI